MNPLEGALLRLGGELRRLGISWALIGGLAVSLRSEPRTTRDIDIALALKSPDEEDHLVRELVALGYRQVDEGTFWQAAADRLATLRQRFTRG